MRLYWLYKLLIFIREEPGEALETAQKLAMLGVALYVGWSIVLVGGTLRVAVAGDRADGLVRAWHSQGGNADRLVVAYALPATNQLAEVYVQSALDRAAYPAGATVPLVFSASDPAKTTYVATFWGLWGAYWTRLLISGGLVAGSWGVMRMGRRYNARNLQPNPEADVRVTRGNALIGQGDLAGAIKEYTAALRIVPSPRIMILRGDAYVHAGQQRAARRDYRRALRWYQDTRRQNDAAVVRQRLGSLNRTG